MLACVDELLDQQVAQTSGGLNGPGSLREGLGPGKQLCRLLTRGPHGDRGHLAFLAADSDCRVALLMGIHPDNQALRV